MERANKRGDFERAARPLAMPLAELPEVNSALHKVKNLAATFKDLVVRNFPARITLGLHRLSRQAQR